MSHVNHMHVTCMRHVVPVLLHVFPGPHSGPPLDVLLQYSSDGISPPSLPVLTQGHRGFVPQVLLVEFVAIKVLHCAQECLELEWSGVEWNRAV